MPACSQTLDPHEALQSCAILSLLSAGLLNAAYFVGFVLV
jgi:hypothetical protein